MNKLTLETPKGTKVVLNHNDGHITGGKLTDVDKANKHLDVNKTYTLQYVSEETFKNLAFLEEMPAIGFNAGMFLIVSK